MVLSPYLPHGKVGHGGGIAVRGVLTHLAKHHEVTLTCFVRPGEKELVSEVQGLGVRTVALPYLDNRARGPDQIRLVTSRARALGRSLTSRYPLYVEKYWSRKDSRRILAVTAELRPDAIQIEYLQLALFIRDLRRWRDSRCTDGSTTSRPRLVLNSHELGSLPRWRRAALASRPWQRLRWQAEARAWERLQRIATTWADTTLCVTDQDRDMLQDQGGRNCRTVPLGVDTTVVQPVWQPSPPRRLLFVGSFGHEPNRSAALFLVDQIWPELASLAESTRLVLAGRGSRAFLDELGPPRPGVQALGFVDDLTSLYRDCQLFVAPLVEGGGIKIKILEAMAHGIPVVTTPIGAEGIVTATDDAAWIAAPDANFAATTRRALQETDESRRRALRARQVIEQRFSWSAITRMLTSIYEGG